MKIETGQFVVRVCYTRVVQIRRAVCLRQRDRDIDQARVAGSDEIFHMEVLEHAINLLRSLFTDILRLPRDDQRLDICIGLLPRCYLTHFATPYMSSSFSTPAENLHTKFSVTTSS
ncbi:hypothetical protein [Caballeronia mineralivorans]|uniref:hypothetical protein n=1 Tax=Caballeronia mineralivorans TaxID=2010198 RepID=UPI002AFEA38D|nr:hypothetical protein [Caballeronia mineralivorans]